MKIALFDSGIGGFTVLAPFVKEARKRSLSFDVTYLGDLANLPYGTKSREQVRTLTADSLEMLKQTLHNELQESSVLMLIACNTASALALDVSMEAFARYPNAHVHGVIEAGCIQAKILAERHGGRIVVLGTNATISTHVHKSSLTQMGFSGAILERACPLFVPIVEEQLFTGPITDLVLAKYLEGFLLPNDSVILGCTHYPLLMTALQEHFPRCHFVDPGQALAEKLFSEHSFTQSSASWSLRSLFTDDTMTQERMDVLLKNLGLKELQSKPELIFEH